MGNCCTNYGDQMYDYVNSPILHPYQEHHLKLWQLDKYDQFFKTVAHPFLDLDIQEFIIDLRMLLNRIDEEKKA